MNVVLYMRYSSDRQTEQSIEGQQRVCMEFCRRENHTVVGTYIDRATSAFKETEKRLEFNRMIKDSEKHQWEGVVVYKLDRFARNRYDAATYKARLKKNGVKVISATENISDSPEGVILEAVLEGMAEFYSMELSQKITRGMRESAFKCNSVGGNVCLGYKIENGKYVIDEAEAQIVREAFRRYAEGESVTEICDTFNRKGYRTKRGGRFNKNSFHAMFKNERYIGVYKYQDIRIDDGMPRIIDNDTFEKVGKMLKQTASAPARKKATVDYLLSGKLFCGHCGASCVGECGKSANGRLYYYYSCGNRKKNGSCDKKPMKKDYIEKLVAEEAVRLLTPEMIEKLADMAIEQNRKDMEGGGLIPALEAELKDLEKKGRNLYKLVENGIESKELFDRIRELEELKKDARTRLKEARDSLHVIVLEREHVIWWLTRFATRDDKKFVIDMFVNSVTVWDEPDGLKMTTVYNLTNDNTRTVNITDDCSDLASVCPPKEYYPNTFVFFDTFFAYTRQYFTPRR